MFIFGIADMFYYTSEDGKKTVRETVFTKVLETLADLATKNNKDDAGISMTCIGHSAGTVILHDLLYNIFSQGYTTKNLPSVLAYLKKKSLLSDVREMAKQKKIRLRKFYTFGSPITPMTVRSNALIKKAVTKGAFLNPEDIGIVEDTGLNNPRWVNFWDPDDLISFPLEFLYDNSAKGIEDKCIDVSDNPFVAHGKYWTDKNVAKYIAETY
jgi:hypothetical protein